MYQISILSDGKLNISDILNNVQLEIKTIFTLILIVKGISVYGTLY